MICPIERTPLHLVIACATALLLVGCAGGDSYTVDIGSMAQRYMPTTKTVDHHPDSLKDFTIVEKEDHFEVALETGYEDLHRKWTSTYQNMGTGRSGRTRSYATFRSKELSLARLEAEVGFSSLTKERARELMERRRNEYEPTLEFEVYWFESEGSSLLAGPGGQVHLNVDGERYRTSSESHGPLRETFIVGEGRALYRRNTFRFSRTQDGTDILADASSMSLVITGAGVGRRVQFAWSWENEE